MKKIKTDIKLVDFKGQVLEEEGEKVTVGYALYNLLSGQSSNPQRSFQLAREFATKKEVDLKAEDIVFIKEILNKSNVQSLITGQLIAILEGDISTDDIDKK